MTSQKRFEIIYEKNLHTRILCLRYTFRVALNPIQSVSVTLLRRLLTLLMHTEGSASIISAMIATLKGNKESLFNLDCIEVRHFVLCCFSAVLQSDTKQLSRGIFSLLLPCVIATNSEALVLTVVVLCTLQSCLY
jgi:hypothetical protein